MSGCGFDRQRAAQNAHALRNARQAKSGAPLRVFRREATPVVTDRERKLTSLYDTLIIASADSNRQVKALAQNVRDKLKEAGAHIIGVEGEQAAEWILVDAGDLVVHVMQPAVRAYYNLEELWAPPAPHVRARAA